MLIKERVFLFEKNKEKYKTWNKEITDWDKKVKKIIKFTADMLKISKKDLDHKITIATNGNVLINHKIAEKYNIIGKVSVLTDQKYSIKNEKNEYLGQWSMFKANSKEYRQIKKYKDEISLPAFCPLEQTHFLNVCRFDYIKAKKLTLEEYGMFFVIDKSYIGKNIENEIKSAKEMKLSEFYKLLEDLDEKENKETKNVL